MPGSVLTVGMLPDVLMREYQRVNDVFGDECHYFYKVGMAAYMKERIGEAIDYAVATVGVVKLNKEQR